MAGSNVVRVCECEFCGRDDLSPQGLRGHQQWCDENPHPGVPPAKLEELREQGVLD